MTAGRGARATVLAAGLVQGLALVAFPATEPVFRAADGFGLSATQYGGMFVPQVILAIAASLAGGALGRRLGLRRVLLCGVAADLLAMALLAASGLLQHTGAGFVVLLVATAALGAGFGLTVPSLNALIADYRPDAADRAVLVLNALLGLGTAAAPVLSAVFVGLGVWWGLPVAVGAAAAAVLVLALRLPPPSRGTAASGSAAGLRASAFAVFAVVALLYGVVETLAGNWSQPFASGAGTGATVASLCLTAFWGVVTAGRVLAAVVEQRIGTPRIAIALPVVVAVSYLGAFLLPQGSGALPIAVFALAGLGCSALLPMMVSLTQGAFPGAGGTVSALVIAFYQAGYGIAAFGVGPLQTAGLGLPAIFGVGAVVAVGLAAAMALATRRSRA